MFRAEIQWLASGPTLKLEGKLVADWAEKARCLVTKDVLPEDLIVDLTELSYVDSVGEQLLKWLASVGAMFVAGSVYGLPYATGCVYRLCRGYPSDASGAWESRGAVTQLNPIQLTPFEGRQRKRAIMSWFHSSTTATRRPRSCIASRNCGLLPGSKKCSG